MTLRDLYELARDFIPEVCRKKVEEHQVYSYWPAHEIGHFLVANKAEIRRFEYGLEEHATSVRGYTHAIVHELAAMHVSGRLLLRTSPRLMRLEIKDTAEETLELRDDPKISARVTRLLRRWQIEQIPTTKAELRRLLRRKRRALGLRP